MKRTFFSLLIILLGAGIVSGQKSKSKNKPEGKWLFEAPTAPEGYTSGAVEITFADAKYSATMSFTGNDYTTNADMVKVENDTVKLNLFVDGTDVVITVKFQSEDKLEGVAVIPDGEIPITLLRDKKKK